MTTAPSTVVDVREPKARTSAKKGGILEACCARTAETGVKTRTTDDDGVEGVRGRPG